MTNNKLVNSKNKTNEESKDMKYEGETKKDFEYDKFFKDEFISDKYQSSGDISTLSLASKYKRCLGFIEAFRDWVIYWNDDTFLSDLFYC